ncbi:MAG: hypothetical protein JWL76_1510 [Thermoleophilia bacterium]|nr:hypothetical protein [Thermoleophilia bacterium]
MPDAAVQTHKEIGGRRWRISDPQLADATRQRLVNELMDARRAVAAANRAADDDARSAARRRVQDAKVALGERGPRWWEPLTDEQLEPRASSAIAALLRTRDPDATICPTDAARVVDAAHWRSRLDLVRAVAAQLHDDGVVEIRQGGAVVRDPRQVRGPMRIGRGSRFDEAW